MSATILYVEHDPVQREAMTRSLGAFDLKVTTAASCADTRLALEQGGVWDLIAMNQELPDGDGIELTRQIRGHSCVPIILLSAKSVELDRILALELGADDYICLPASPRELVARVRAVLRRVNRKPAAPPPAPADRRPNWARTYRFAGWELNVPRRMLTNPQGQRVVLTNTEFGVLVAFLDRAQQVISRDQLLQATRLHCDVYDRSIDVQVLRLRRKIEPDPVRPQLIRTARGAGYIFSIDVEIVAA